MNDEEAVPEPQSGRALGTRELEAAHEIAQAFLAATQPIEVYRLALARVTPMVRAHFAAVFLRDERHADLLRPVCLHGWPQASARYLGQMRIRVGLGPTGRTVEENTPVEVSDVFADDTLHDWHEPARELGFASMITLPLATQTSVNGAVSFYYSEPHEFSEEERSLLRLISEQLAATTTRARVLDELRIENERLRRDGEHLAATIREAEIDTKRHDRMMAEVIDELSRSVEQTDAAGLISDLGELLDLRLGRAKIDASPGDGLRLARLAAERAGAPQPGAEFTIDEGEAIVPLTTDSARVVRVLTGMLKDAFRRTVRGRIVLAVRAVEDESGPWVEWTVTARGMGIDAGGGSASKAADHGGSDRLGEILATTTTEALGGSLDTETGPENGWSQRLRLPLRSEQPAMVREAGVQA